MKKRDFALRKPFNYLITEKEIVANKGTGFILDPFLLLSAISSQTDKLLLH